MPKQVSQSILREAVNQLRPTIDDIAAEIDVHAGTLRAYHSEIRRPPRRVQLALAKYLRKKSMELRRLASQIERDVSGEKG